VARNAETLHKCCPNRKYDQLVEMVEILVVGIAIKKTVFFEV